MTTTQLDVFIAGLATPGVSITPVGLDIGAEVTETELDAFGRALANVGHARMWAIGDWLLAKAGRFHVRYGDACAVAGFSYDSAARYALVAECVERERRRPDLSFAHHHAVAHLPPAEQVARLVWAARDAERAEALANGEAPPEPHSAVALRRKIRDDAAAIQAAADALAKAGASAMATPDTSQTSEMKTATPQATTEYGSEEWHVAKAASSVTFTLTVQGQADDLAAVHATLRRMADGLEVWLPPRDLHRGPCPPRPGRTVTKTLNGATTRERILAALAGANGAAMTERELAEATRRAPSTIHKHLYALRVEGLIRWDPPKKRTARIATRISTDEGHAETESR